MGHRTCRAVALALSVASAMMSAGCSEKMCPTIACVPRIDLTFENPVTAPYRLTVMLAFDTVVENCPATRTDLGLTPGVSSCDDTHATITGIDLGHANNDVIGMNVSLGGQLLSATATLQTIVNSRDCDLVCYQHVGSVQNLR